MDSIIKLLIALIEPISCLLKPNRIKIINEIKLLKEIESDTKLLFKLSSKLEEEISINIFGIYTNQEQWQKLNELAINPNLKIQWNTIKSAKQYIRFDRQNNPYINITKLDKIWNCSQIVLFVILISLSACLNYKYGGMQKTLNDKILFVGILIFIVFFAYLFISQSFGFLSARVIKSELEKSEEND